MGETVAAVALQVAGPAHLVFVELTIQPGATTGWHWHPGPLLVVVKAGTLTRYGAAGQVSVHGAGDALVEPAGDHHVHCGVNHGGEPVVVLAAYLVPTGAPLSVDAALDELLGGVTYPAGPAYRPWSECSIPPQRVP